MSMLSEDELSQINQGHWGHGTVTRLLSHIDALTAANQELQQQKDKLTYYLVLAETREETLEGVIAKFTAQIEEARKMLCEAQEYSHSPFILKRVEKAKQLLATLERKGEDA